MTELPTMGFAGGFGLMALVAFLVAIAFWGAIIALVVLGVRWLIRQERASRLPPDSSTQPRADDPLEILRSRYARGEIDDEEYERRRRTLGTG
jgi:putative membrane protein